MKKRIVFITREGPKLSGARVRCYGFAHELRKSGIDCKVFSFAEELGAKYGEAEFDMSVFKKTRLIYKAFKKLAKEDKDTIFYIQRLNYHSVAPFLLHLMKKNRVIFDMDDWDMREDARYHFGFYPNSKAEYFTRHIAKHSLFCVVASRYLFNYLSEFNKYVCYAPTGADIDKFRPILQDKSRKELVISWIGTVYHGEMFENINFLIDCFAEVYKKYPFVRLEIVGTGRYFSEIHKTALKFAKNGNISVRGWIEPENIPSYLLGVDIGVLPLVQNMKFNLAKSPTKLFEYMAMSKPVVSSALGEAAHVISEGKNGLLARNREEFINKLNLLVSDDKTRVEMGLNARKSVEENYSLLNSARKIHEFINILT